jgi:hypothetical protein
MLTKKDLELNDKYLSELVKSSRRKDIAAFNEFAPLSSSSYMRTRNTIEKQQAKEKPAFTLVTEIVFPLKCRCGFSWSYRPKKYNPRRVYCLCPRCRCAVRIKGEISSVRGRKPGSV